MCSNAGVRWEGQKIDDGAAAALLPMKGLLRSVRTPEFEGVTFHEVAAKSALNKVPAQSNMPFRWTINPMRGCLHQCRYCLSPETLILMADGRQKPLREVKVGEKVVGTRLEGRYRYFVESEVQAFWHTRKPAYRVSLADGTEIVASGDHRFLTERGWKSVAPGGGSDVASVLTVQDQLAGPEKIDDDGGLLGSVATSRTGLQVTAVEPLGSEQDLIDITTSTGDFIANGVLSHNCFARRTHEYLDLDAGRDFDTQIVVKTNVAEVLRAEVSKPSWCREHVALGTNTDPYQRAEGRYRLMPGIIQALADSGTPFSILTKGPLLTRDLPLLKQAAQQVEVSVGVSLAIMDPELQQQVEPGTPTAAARLKLVRALADAGLSVNVLAMPILPWLTDSAEHLDLLHARLKEAGANWVSTGALHLRPGAREWYMQWLQEQYPQLVPKYRRLYRGAKGGFTSYAHKDYTSWLADQAAQARRRHGFIRRENPRWARNNPEGRDGGDQPEQQEPQLPGLESITPGQQPALF